MSSYEDNLDPGYLHVKIKIGDAWGMRDDAPDHVDELRQQWARELPDLDTSPMTTLGRVYRLAQLVAPAIGRERGEFDVSGTLRRSGPPYCLTPTELYRSLMIASGSLTHRLARLEKMRLVYRRRNENDGRSLVVELTRKGQQLAEQAFRGDMELEAALLEDLDAASRTRFAADLKRVTAALERRLRALAPIG